MPPPGDAVRATGGTEPQPKPLPALVLLSIPPCRGVLRGGCCPPELEQAHGGWKCCAGTGQWCVPLRQGPGCAVPRRWQPICAARDLLTVLAAQLLSQLDGFMASSVLGLCWEPPSCSWPQHCAGAGQEYPRKGNAAPGALPKPCACPHSTSPALISLGPTGIDLSHLVQPHQG